ncbi:GIY-YIG nuclease family protein [Microbulbifer variabilis]|uniref:GIY-YIG nuclease family protein n=1 Tax=Microbulbifer variabilis TaxID=266805 RepID=A0ABY4VGU6_9GAMM|nr:GIY-YIG nuclease family protein [Microbulbifer variabilis]USD23307.1 GIY-YIG nuclease family protein [Microbulbifer variabilis]
MISEEYSVYWIRLHNHKDIYKQGYIGVTNNIERRWNQHKSQILETDKKVNKRPLYRAFRKLGLECFDFSVVEGGLDKWTAHNLEFCLRPHKNIGYNFAQGGNLYGSPLLCSTLSSIVADPKSRQKVLSGFKEAIIYYSKTEKEHNNRMYLTIKNVLPFQNGPFYLSSNFSLKLK